MKTRSLEILEKSHLPPAQAKAILQVVEDELMERDAVLATKSDIAMSADHFRAEMAQLRTEIAQGFAQLDRRISEVQSRLLTLILSCFISQTALFTGMLYFLLGKR